MPVGWWFVELAVVVAGVSYYWKLEERSFGDRAWAVAAVVVLLHIMNSPWLSPK
jgi:hypothetical protein